MDFMNLEKKVCIYIVKVIMNKKGVSIVFYCFLFNILLKKMDLCVIVIYI